MRRPESGRATRRIWFERAFPVGMPLDAFPDVIERLRGTPLRLEERLRSTAPELRVLRVDGSWSAQENAGHLGDLESLWRTRLEELAAGRTELSPADLENRRTEEAGHNERELEGILREFRGAREATVGRLESLDAETLRHTALHPRLGQPMTLVDLFYFVAEHDDHHLARITEIGTALAGGRARVGRP